MPLGAVIHRVLYGAKPRRAAEPEPERESDYREENDVTAGISRIGDVATESRYNDDQWTEYLGENTTVDLRDGRG